MRDSSVVGAVSGVLTSPPRNQRSNAPCCGEFMPFLSWSHSLHGVALDRVTSKITEMCGYL
jgi:hypothetical protein